jgi:hypothetical protein
MIINSNDNQSYISHVLNKNQLPMNITTNSETEYNRERNTYVASYRRSREEYFRIVQNTIQRLDDQDDDYRDLRGHRWETQ